MFIYESKIKLDSEAVVECLNVKFGTDQIPTDTPDVKLYKDDSDVVHVFVGETEYTSATE